MTDQEFRDIVNGVIANESDPDEVAKLELVREYFSNPDFRQWMSDTVYRLVS